MRQHVHTTQAHRSAASHGEVRESGLVEHADELILVVPGHLRDGVLEVVRDGLHGHLVLRVTARHSMASGWSVATSVCNTGDRCRAHTCNQHRNKCCLSHAQTLWVVSAAAVCAGSSGRGRSRASRVLSSQAGTRTSPSLCNCCPHISMKQSPRVQQQQSSVRSVSALAHHPALTAAPAMRLKAAPLRPKRPLRPMRCR